MTVTRAPTPRQRPAEPRSGSGVPAPPPAPRRAVGRWGLAFVLLCFTGSGITGLIYQVLWVRMIERVVGTAPFAIAIVLAVFMGGLGLGSYLASRWVDRSAGWAPRLVRIYGLLELGIGLYAILVPLLLAGMRPVYALLYRSLEGQFLLFNFVTCAFAGAVLLLPTTLMGATLPLLCRYVVSELDSLGRRTGLLYGLNTLGAAAGALLAGTVLLSAFGVTGTLAGAVVVNGVIGTGCLVFAARRPAAQAREPRHRVDGDRPRAGAAVERTPAVMVVYAVLAVSGFCSFACEVILTRLVSLIVGPTTYSFTVVLVTFITGLALGSLVLGWLGDRVARPDLLLLWSQLGAAGTLLVASQLLGDSQFFFSKLLFTFRESFDQQQLMKATALFAFMIVPTVLLGGTFPLAGKLLARSPETVGRALGVGYAVNTLGCVAGSATAGFLLLPLVGGELGLSLVASLQILTAGAGIALSPGSPRVRWGTLAVSAAGLLCCVAMPRWDQVSLASSKYHRLQQLVPSLLSHGWWDALVGGRRVLASMSRGELLYHGQGVGGVTTVLRTRDVLGNPEISMANSGKFDASSVGDMKTQVLLAHVPMVMHAEPELVMVLGLASGVTAGEVLYYPSVRRMDILEIGSQVVDGSRFFDELNNRVLDHPKAHLIIQDARAHLALSGERYDVIVSEPSNPWMAGMADLFTREFFTLARSRLRPGGAFAQFIHSYEIDWDSFALVLRTFADVFPGAVMLATHPAQEGADYLLVGFADPTQRLSLDGTAERREALQRSRNVRLADPSLLYRLVVTEDLPALAGDGPLNTEDHPILEFSAPRALYVADASIRERIRQRRRVLPGTAERVQALVDDPEAAIAYAEFALSLRTPFAGMEPAHASDAQQRRFGDLISAYAEQFPIDCDFFRDAAVASECLRRQIGALERRTAQLDADGLAYLADLHARAGRVTEARAGFEAALAREPMTLLALNGLGMLAGQAGDHAAAIGYFREAQRLNPFLVEPYLNLGVAYLALGERQQAARQFTTALNLDPSSALAKRGLRQSLQP